MIPPVTCVMQTIVFISFQLTASNVEGKSSPSDILVCTTSPDRPGPPTRPVIKEPITSHDLSVKWGKSSLSCHKTSFYISDPWNQGVQEGAVVADSCFFLKKIFPSLFDDFYCCTLTFVCATQFLPWVWVSCTDTTQYQMKTGAARMGTGELWGKREGQVWINSNTIINLVNIRVHTDLILKQEFVEIFESNFLLSS